MKHQAELGRGESLTSNLATSLHLTPQLHPKACLFLTSEISCKPEIWLWLQGRKQPICSIQRRAKAEKKRRRGRGGISLKFFFNLILYKVYLEEGLDCGFVCFVLKLPVPKRTMSIEMRWGQVGFQPAGSSLLHPKGILEGFGILQIFSLETMGGAQTHSIQLTVDK